MRLSVELYNAMKEVVDYLGDCTDAYISGDVTKDKKFRPSIISSSARTVPSQTL